MQQAARVAEFTGFFLLGKLIEFDKTEKIFTKPSDKKTEDYITEIRISSSDRKVRIMRTPLSTRA